MKPDLAGSNGFVRNCRYVAGCSEDFARELSDIAMYADDPAFSEHMSRRTRTASPEAKDVFERVQKAMANRRGSYPNLALDETASPNPVIQNPQQTEPYR